MKGLLSVLTMKAVLIDFERSSWVSFEDDAEGDGGSDLGRVLELPLHAAGRGRRALEGQRVEK